MNMSISFLQYDINIHMVHNSHLQMDIIHCMYNSVKDNNMRWIITINCRINSDKQRILYICITNTLNVDRHKIQHKLYPMK